MQWWLSVAWTKYILYIILSLVHFRLRWYICTLRKIHTSSDPSVRSFPQCCPWNSSGVVLIDDGPLRSFERRSSSAFSFYASPPGDRSCNALSVVLAGGLSSLPTLPIVGDANPSCDGCFAPAHGVYSVPNAPTDFRKENVINTYFVMCVKEKKLNSLQPILMPVDCIMSSVLQTSKHSRRIWALLIRVWGQSYKFGVRFISVKLAVSPHVNRSLSNTGQYTWTRISFSSDQ